MFLNIFIGILNGYLISIWLFWFEKKMVVGFRCVIGIKCNFYEIIRDMNMDEEYI